MNCDSCELPKNAWMTALHGARVDQIVERDPLGIVVDAHPLLDQARHARQADENWLAISSPTERTRRLPRWSMSSV